MGFYRGPHVVTDGLVLWLDAANRSSYPGSGVTWRDLSGLGNNGTLTNGPTFSSASLGSIVFDGTNDNISNISNPSVTNQITCEAWFNADISNITGSITSAWIMGREGSYRIIYGATGFSWVCRTDSNGWYTAGTFLGADINYSINNIWFHVVGTYNSSFNSMYINGQLMSTGSTISGNVGNTGTFFIARSDAPGSVNYGMGKGSIYRVYNRALSAQEVKQNYDALKGRYNLI